MQYIFIEKNGLYGLKNTQNGHKVIPPTHLTKLTVIVEFRYFQKDNTGRPENRKYIHPILTLEQIEDICSQLHKIAVGQ